MQENSLPSEEYAFDDIEAQRYDKLSLAGTVRALKDDQQVEGVSLIANTRNASVYRIELGETVGILRTVIPGRIADDAYEEDPEIVQGVEDRIDHLLIGKGLDGLEQIITYSIDDLAVLTEAAPGVSIKDLSPDKVAKMSREHFEALAILLDKCEAPGIIIDQDPENVFFDAEKGFTLIDYYAAEGGESLSSELQFGLFLEVGLCNLAEQQSDPEHRQVLKDAVGRGLEVMRTHYRAEPATIAPALVQRYQTL